MPLQVYALRGHLMSDDNMHQMEIPTLILLCLNHPLKFSGGNGLGV